MSDYPEHERLKTVKERSQAIGEFLDVFLPSKGLVLAYYKLMPNSDCLMTASYNIDNLLAEFFEIDQDKLENEKQNMLEEIRKGNKS